jgi:membrane-bound hydrogenase subunit beta
MSDAPSPAGIPAPGPAASPAPITGPIQSLADELKAKFALPDAALKVQRATRLWVDVDQAGFAPVFDHLVKGMGFSILCTITGLDLGADLGLIYHLARDGGIMANVKTKVPKGQAMTSVTPYFPGAAIYEREVEDLLGASFTGRPDMPRYPLPEDWPQGDHPLLKDWKPRGARAAQTAAEAAAAPAAGSAPAAEKGAAPNV